MSLLEIDVELERRPRSGPPFELRAELACRPGITVVFGPSGAGKSTLLLAALGALRPRAGRIAIGARALFDAARGIDLPVRVRRLGVVFQDALLFPHMDVLQNVRFGVRGGRRDSGSRGAGIELRARELLERVGAADLAMRRPSELSGGERQRCALARALASGPEALLLDEPFAALDVAARRALGEVLLALARETGIPFLHVTHDPAEALRIGTTLALMDRGRITAVGKPAEVLATPAARGAEDAPESYLEGRVGRQQRLDGVTDVDLGGIVVEVSPLAASEGSRVVLALRAEDVLIAREAVKTSARNVIPGVVREVEAHAGGLLVTVATPLLVRALVTAGAVRDLGLVPGARVHLLVKAHAFRAV